MTVVQIRYGTYLNHEQPTVCEAIEYSGKEPFSLLAHELDIVVRSTTPSALLLIVRNSKDILAILVLQRYVYMPVRPFSISLIIFEEHMPASSRKLEIVSAAMGIVDNNERTFPQGFAMKLGMTPCFMPRLFAVNLNRMALSAIRIAFRYASAVSNTPGPVSVSRVRYQYTGTRRIEGRTHDAPQSLYQSPHCDHTGLGSTPDSVVCAGGSSHALSIG
jgi:hypothetical protein